MCIFKFTYETDEGEEIEAELPGKRVVCSRCEGYGTHLNPSIGEHAYTPEEFEESFDDEESRGEYFKRGGRYDVCCEACGGERVITEIDSDACKTPEQKTLLATFDRIADAEADYAAECAAERRAGC